MPYPELLSGQGPPPGFAPAPQYDRSHKQPGQQPAPQQSGYADTSQVKLTRGTSCVLCQQRKVRCDKNKPCANCVKAGVECRVIPPQPPRRRKKRLQEKDLVDRIKKYESLLSDNGIRFESISQELRSDGHAMDDVDELENDFEGLKTTPSASASPSGTSQTDAGRQKVGQSFNLHKEFRASERLLQDSSEDDVDASTIHKAFDRIYSAQDGFPFMIGATYSSVTKNHPSTIHIFQLWQIYVDNINPLLKITHIPTIQPQFIQAASQLESAPKNIEALMFGIYLMAITSLEDDDVQAQFYETKRELLGRFFIGVQQSLVNADFMRSNDTITLQALFLYLMAVRWFVDPRQVFCLLGIAIRIAQRVGLHRDPGGFGLPPFEVEQRRRLWWAIVGYDRRVGEMSGSTVSALSSGGDCKPPLNVNDSDLHIDGEEMPAPHTGPTEMLFALTRIELAMAVSSNSNRDSHNINSAKEPPAATGASKGPIVKLVGVDGPGYTMDGFCAHVEGTYLQHCDPKIPLHFFTLTMTRQALCKMKIVSFLVRLNDCESMPLAEVERDNLFLQAVQMIEYDNVVQASESLRPFKWYAMHYFPFPAYMFLVRELKLRITGMMVERAWDAVTRNYDLRGLLSNKHSPMHVAFSGLFIKAWDTHQSAMRNAAKDVVEPYFIGVLKERAAKRRQAKAENRVDPSLEQRPVDMPRSTQMDQAVLTMDKAAMATPPEGQAAPAGTEPLISGLAPASGPIPPSVHSDDHEDQMDWSYMVMNGNPYGNVGQGYNGAMPFGGAGMPGPQGPMGGGLGNGSLF